MRPILLTLMLVLLLTGSGEAGEKIKIIDIPTSGCTAGQTWNGKEFPPPTCEQRMKEAMKEMDERLEHFNGLTEGCPRDHYCEKIEQRFVEGTKLSRLWREVVNNCVKETP